MPGPSQAQDAMDDLQSVRQRTAQLLAGGSGDGAYKTRSQAVLDERVEEILTTPMQPLVWSDPQDTQFNQRLDRFLAKTRALTQGWAGQGRYAGDEQVLTRILAEVDHALDNYNAQTPRPGNW